MTHSALLENHLDAYGATPDMYDEFFQAVLAVIEECLGSTRRAISDYEDFIVLFPQSDYLGEVEANLKKMENQLASSRLDLGDFYYYYRNNNTAALVFYNEAITIEPKSDAADEARLRIDDIEKGVRPISNASLLRKLLGVN